MGLKNYKEWIKLDEEFYYRDVSTFQFLRQWIFDKGIQEIIDYADILNEPDYIEHEGPILNEINYFEKFLNVLGGDARGESKAAEDLVAILLKGNNSNVQGEADTIFSDVTLKDGEKISVKASKKLGFIEVLNSTKIKTNQILSIIFSNGLSSVSDKQKEIFFAKLADPQAMQQVRPIGSYSIAACYKKGNDFVVEKTNAVSGEDLKLAYMANVNNPKIKGDNKGRVSADAVLQNILGFKPSQRFVIKGMTNAEITKISSERKIILQKIELLPTSDLRSIAYDYDIFF
jgi:hypothetical protein